MDERLLRIYNRELQHLREMGEEFAQEFPKIAGRLGMEGIECADPYVERLLEGFAFLASRVQLKIESQFPRFTQHIFEKTYPQYLCPLPSMTIVQFHPNHSEGDLTQGPVVPRGSLLRSNLGNLEQTRCTFSTAHDVALWPLEISQVEYHTRDLSSLEIGDLQRSKAAIRIRLHAQAGLKIKDIALENLVLHIRGAGGTAMRIYEQLMVHTRAVVVHSKARPSKVFGRLDAQSVVEHGFEDDQALLPVSAPSFQGYRLLQEYFALPERFLFFEVQGLAEAVKQCPDEDIELTFLLDKSDIELDGAVSEANFALGCSPAINLFERRLDRIHISDRDFEYHLVPERTAPLDFEIHSVQAVSGFGAGGPTDEQVFESFYAARDTYHESGHCYFSMHRVPRMLSQREKQGHRRSSRYAGSDVYLSLVDSSAAPFRSDLQQLGVKALCTNRDLPIHMPIGQSDTDFTIDLGLPVSAVKCLGMPTTPLPSQAEGNHTWRLVSHLTPHYLSILDTEGGEAGAAMREILGLYGDMGRPEVRRQIDGVRSVTSKPILRRVERGGPISFARGLEIELTMDEMAFEGSGIYLLGSVLNRFFARFVTMNVFTETVLCSMQRGEVKRWPAMAGNQKNL